jgi:hypothetical protein
MYHVYISQIETILDTVSALIVEVKLALEQIILAHSPSEGCRSQKGNVGEVLGKSLKNVSYYKCNKFFMHFTLI